AIIAVVVTPVAVMVVGAGGAGQGGQGGSGQDRRRDQLACVHLSIPAFGARRSRSATLRREFARRRWRLAEAEFQLRFILVNRRPIRFTAYRRPSARRADRACR